MPRAARYRPPAAVVFDCDGVLIESVDIKTQAFRELFAEHPQHHEAIARHHQEHLGISRFEKFRWIYRELLHREITATESMELGERFAALVSTGTRFCPEVPGASETLSTLQAKGIPLFVASGTPQDELVAVIAARGWSARFRGIYGSPRTKPEILASIAGTVAAPTARLIFVGDGESDYDAARRAGATFVLRETAVQEDRFRDFRGARIEDLVGFGAKLPEFAAPAAPTDP